MPYSAFLTERQALVDARQRTQQRVDQLITAGAAGALILSITFLENIAPAPHPIKIAILVFSWILLLSSLGTNLLSHYASEAAFDAQIDAFDEAFIKNRDCVADTSKARRAGVLNRVSALLFVAGVALLAVFSITSIM